MLSLRRPSVQKLQHVIERQEAKSLTYEAVGATLTGHLPAGYRHDHVDVVLGQGEAAFERARTALANWEPQRGGGLTVVADGPLAEGTTVALAAPLPLGFAIAACRVVGVVDASDQFGFSYGTLPEHPEEGEELFLVERGADGLVRFQIVAFSRPHQLLARVARPVAHRLQRAATSRYLAAMKRAVP